MPIPDGDPGAPVAARGAHRRRRARLAAARAGLVLLCLGAGFALVVRHRLLASVPRLEGSRTIPALTSPVRIARDALGVPTIEASNRLDASLALGYLHAQDRFFQMDLMRRSAAGELAALFGRGLLAADRAVRVHRMRRIAERVLERVDPAERAHAEAYARGVAAGLADLGAPPFEYTLLATRPEPWRAEDTILVILAMFLDLGDSAGNHDAAIGLLYDTLPESLAVFLDARGTSWDAPLDGTPVAEAPIPSPRVVNLRTSSHAQQTPAPSEAGGEPGAALPPVVAAAPRAASAFAWSAARQPQEFALGSNNWAVAGTHTANGCALLAGDMHLGLGVPNTWYRASIVVAADGDRPAGSRTTGVTLPGAPAIIAGSNGDVAWAFTNSEVDAVDLVLLEMVDAESGVYRVPEGLARLESHVERIAVRGGRDDTLTVQTCRWGPLLGRDFAGRRRVLRWTAHDPAALDLRILGMEQVRNVDEALALAPRCGIPPQNCVIADRDGRIGWTIMGRLPRRVGFDGRRPVSWAAGRCRWDGLLDPKATPRLVDPPEGRIWTANNRVLGGAALALLGDGGYGLGARAHQIRAALLASEAVRPSDMMRLQLDDRALILERWQALLLSALTPEVAAADPRRETARRLVASWGGRAAVESAGYRIVRRFRDTLLDEVFMALAAPCKRTDARFDPREFTQREGPVWRLLEAQPPHLLAAQYPSWEALVLAAVDTTLGRLAPVPRAARSMNGGAAARRTACAAAARELDRRTWGERNTVHIQHPLSLVAPFLGRWLDMPRRPLPGDVNMPRVQSPAGGASQRLVVAPGHEADGIFHMPGGQSGHPLSPHYRDGHAAWEQGLPTPFLPGPVRHRLQLLPAGGTPSVP